MGDLERDTAVVDIGDAHFTAELSREWEIWGPMGGYIASFALRAAGAVSPFDRPASFFCHYLSVASFDAPIDLTVTTIRQARTAAAHRVEITQQGKAVLEATVWSIGEVEGLTHDLTRPPAVPGPDETPDLQDLLTDDQKAEGLSFPFWNNFDTRALDFRADWPPPTPLPPHFRRWTRFTPTRTFEDPWVDACRSLILIDVQSWPAAHQPHAWKKVPFIAPSLDLYVAFNDPQPKSDWLLCDGHSPVARDGLMAWNGRLWSVDRKLVASGSGQILCRRIPAP